MSLLSARYTSSDGKSVERESASGVVLRRRRGGTGVLINDPRAGAGVR
jgi:hypothetical protein